MKSALLVLALAAPAAAGQTFMPPNELHYEQSAKPDTMGKAQFDAVLTKAEAFYGPVIKAHGKKLTIVRKWQDATVNASAYQTGDTWYLNMYGGLARRVTEDGFLAVVCHELGHHLAGMPFYAYNNWASVEGNSDYFATQACLREVFAEETEANAAYSKLVPALPKSKCDKAWSGLDDRNLCYRVVVAGKSLGDLLSSGTAKYETPSKQVVPKTNPNHPQGQCRLDTYLAGALCAVSFDKGVIPGKDLGEKRNSVQGEQASADASCSVSHADPAESLRPRCWFKSQF